MRKQSDFKGQTVTGVMTILVGVYPLWKGIIAFLHHVPMYYFRAPQNPWQGIVVGIACLAFGLFIVFDALQKKRRM